jgi:hypothetical protein
VQIGAPVKVLLLVVVVIVSASGTLAVKHALGSRSAAPDLSRLPPVSEVSPTIAPSPTADSTPTPSPAPTPLPAAFRLGVPFTTQAPNGDWARHQNSCEEANLLQVDAYWKGNRASTLDSNAAEKGIADLVAWQVKNWGSEDDLTNKRLGELAAQYYGYQYEIQPMSEDGMKRSIANGIPVILGVTTHGLGNPHYPNYQSHYLQPGYSVSHYVTIVGYDDQGFILNDPGITPGHGYHVLYDRLVFAIDNLDQQRPTLNEGRVMLLIRPKP